MAVYKNSKYVHTPAYIRNGETLILSIRKRNKFNEQDFIYYTVIQGDTIDGIAYRTYGNAQLGWAILDANPQYLTEMDIKAGDLIAIPSFEEVVIACE